MSAECSAVNTVWVAECPRQETAGQRWSSPPNCSPRQKTGPDRQTGHLLYWVPGAHRAVTPPKPSVV